ncbi:MAG: hypothetical protein ABIB79_02700 [archaeon]
MKKKGVKKRASVKRVVKKSSVKSKSRFSDKQWLAITIGLFIVLGFALNFVGVDNTANITGQATITGEGIWGSLDDILMGTLSFKEGGGASFLRWTIFIMLTLFIYSMIKVTDILPIGPFVRFLLSMFVAFISVAVLNQADLVASIQSYGALGLTLISALPLLVIFLFTSQLLQPPVTVSKIIFQLIVWYYYLAFLIYVFVRYVGGLGIGFRFWALDWWKLSIEKGGMPILVIVGSALIAIVVLFFNKWFRKNIRLLGREIARGVSEDISGYRVQQQKEMHGRSGSYKEYGNL